MEVGLIVNTEWGRGGRCHGLLQGEKHEKPVTIVSAPIKIQTEYL